jgi:polysaccharide deacetylase family protein (PEP-CTERM system associated)
MTVQGRNVARKVMTVDVEDYFQVAAFKDVISPKDWGNYDFRAGDRTREILDLFDETGTKATFFVLGWVAQRDPELVKRISSRGHEVASHGFWHQKAFEQSFGEFSDDVVRAKSDLEHLTGKPVIGYRAPSFSIDKRNEHAFDCLRDAGYIYSSSTYPVAHDHYGVPDWPTEPYILDNGLREFPQATIDRFNRRLPVGGGGYFRLFPYALSKSFIHQFEKQHNTPYIFYFHPWEIDPNQPRVTGAGWKSNFRHYVNLQRMQPKIARLCKDFEWGRFDSLLGKDLL